MRVLVACEFSGRVRDALIKRGHDAVSCDFLPSEGNPQGSHYIGDVMDILYGEWDMMIAFPPCTNLAGAGARWWKDRQKEQIRDLAFVQTLMDAPINKICIENPVGKISTAIRKPDQIVNPYLFGHGEKKRTCLWLKGLPKLEPTDVVEGREEKSWLMPDSLGRSKRRSLTYQGIANAMAAQWG